MRAYGARLQRIFEELEFQQDAGDAEVANQEAGELFKGDIKDENVAIEYAVNSELFDGDGNIIYKEDFEREDMEDIEYQDEGMIFSEDFDEDEMFSA